MNWQTWWDFRGSAMRPLGNENMEDFARRITYEAWDSFSIEACTAGDYSEAYWMGRNAGGLSRIPHIQKDLVLVEREACAQLCEDASTPQEGYDMTDEQWAAKMLAGRIRARSKA
jgi:hypothetical protein